jgi:uncharacterized protein YgiM (DUF1202 family)
MKKEEAVNRQQRWERGDNEMRNRKTTASWQNDTAELSRKEQMIISRFRTGYTRATHRHVIEKTDSPNCPFCDVQLTTDHILWQYVTKHATKETNARSDAQYGRREEKEARN